MPLFSRYQTMGLWLTSLRHAQSWNQSFELTASFLISLAPTEVSWCASMQATIAALSKRCAACTPACDLNDAYEQHLGSQLGVMDAI